MKSVLIICSKCNGEKPDAEFKCKGHGIYPELCISCFRKKKSSYMKEYYRRPEVNTARKKYEMAYRQIPGISERARARSKEHRESDNGKARRVEWMSEYLEKPGKLDMRRSYGRKSYNNPDIKERKRRYTKEYYKRQDEKERVKLKLQMPEAKERVKRINRSDISSAADRYIKYLIRQKSGRTLGAKEIPVELIETQRQSIMLKRTIKQKKEENEQHTTTDV